MKLEIEVTLEELQALTWGVISEDNQHVKLHSKLFDLWIEEATKDNNNLFEGLMKDEI